MQGPVGRDLQKKKIINISLQNKRTGILESYPLAPRKGLALSLASVSAGLGGKAGCPEQSLVLLRAESCRLSSTVLLTCTVF